MKVIWTSVLIAGVAISAAGYAAAQNVDTGDAENGNVEKGKVVFSQCMACHQLEKNMVGPMLKGVIGRKAGSTDFARYSPLMKAAGEAGLTWTEAEVVDYLKNPTEYLTKYDKDNGKEASGQSKMLYKLSGEQQRKDVVAYLASVK